MIDYEKLDVYRAALQFVTETAQLRNGVPKGNSELVDQFKRASFSVVLNIAEGAGKFKRPDKQRYFAIARGSAMECGALLDLFRVTSIVQEQEYQSAKKFLKRIVAMLSALCFNK